MQNIKWHVEDKKQEEVYVWYGCHKPEEGQWERISKTAGWVNRNNYNINIITRIATPYALSKAMCLVPRTKVGIISGLSHSLLISQVEKWENLQSVL